MLPDDLGLFGMADDIYVIERAALKLGGFKTGENLLFEFEGYSSAIKGILMEEEGKLIPLSLSTRLMLSSMNYLIDSGKKRFVFALPEPGPAGWLALLYLFLKRQKRLKVSLFFQIRGQIFISRFGMATFRQGILAKRLSRMKISMLLLLMIESVKKFMRLDQARNVCFSRGLTEEYLQTKYNSKNTDIEVSALFEE